MDERNYSLACILLSVTCMIFSGCAIFTYDQSTKPEMSVLVGHTFAIENDSFLITNRCIVRPDKGECLYIQEAGGNIVVSKNGYIKDARLPNSMPDYIKNKALYDADLSDSGFLLYRPRNVAGYVPAGTKIQITKLVSWPLGDTGRCWIVQGNLEMGAGIQPVQIPSCTENALHADPLWFKDTCNEDYDCPPKPDPNLLTEIKSKIR